MSEIAGEYFAKSAWLWKEKGFNVDYVGMFNEPLVKMDEGGHVGMYTLPGDEANIAKSLKRNLISLGFDMKRTKIVGYAHNFDRPDYPQDLLSKADGSVNIISWHCYVDHPDNITGVVHAFPNVEHLMGECTPYTGAQPNQIEYWNNAPNGAKTIYYDDMNSGIGAVIEWNIVLETPKGTDLVYHGRGCKGCRGMINSIKSTEYQIACITPEYYAMRQYSPFLRNGFYRVDYSISGDNACVFVNTFKSDETQAVVAVVHNMCEQDQSIAINIGIDISVQKVVGAQTSATFQFDSPVINFDLDIQFWPSSDIEICGISNVDTKAVNKRIK